MVLPEHELSRLLWLLRRLGGKLGTSPRGWDCTGRLAAAVPGLPGAASGRAPPGRFCGQGSASESPASAAAE